MESNQIKCPKCGSTQITAHGSSKIKITCLACGHEFKPGDFKRKEDLKKSIEQWKIIQNKRKNGEQLTELEQKIVKRRKLNKTILMVIGGFIALLIIGSLLPDSKNDNQTTQSQNHKPKEKDAVRNSELDGSVSQVKEYLKENLKDWDSYESIDWGEVQKYGLATDVTGMGEINRNVLPRTGPAKSFAPDSSGKMDKGEKVYILSKNNGWEKIRVTPNDSITDTRNGLDYWSAWVPENSIKPIVIDTITKYSVWHKYRAKNSFGGYEISDQTFYFDKDGNVIRVENNQ